VIIEAEQDTVVAARVAGKFDAAGIATHCVAMPDTQALETFRAAGQLADVFAEYALQKDDLVIAVGGGGHLRSRGLHGSHVQPRHEALPDSDDPGCPG
jgi:3-dehydroquinate synthetase